jgi:large subunit ribosomal protein L21
MFAIIKTGGKQYKVAANDVIMIEKLAGASGDLIEFTDVLMMGDGDSIKVGAPLVSKATVCGTVLDQIRDDKVIVFKKKKRHNYRRKNGHRQSLTVVRITDILADGASRKAKPAEVKASAKAPEAAAPEKPKAKKAAPKDEKPAVKKEAAKPKKATKKVGE